ncbi:MAG TPA: DUF885 domain-containing protein [Candidatus Krumholzibacteria bacterium]|nr:DUF885 domain-containing protein [Candidatus Krumholzibacteria bacterium]
MALLTGLVMMTSYAMAATPAESLKQLMAEHWEFEMREDPLFATQTGDHRFNDKLPSVAVADEVRREAATRDFLKRLEAIDRAQLGATDALNYDLLRRSFRNRIGEYEFKTYLMPITNREGFHTDFPQLPDRVPLDNTKDYENYCARLEACNAYMNQYVGVMREGVKAGYVLPKVVMEGWETAVDAHIVDDPTKSLLYAPFENYPDDVPAGDRAGLTERGKKAITGSVVPGYRALRDFMAKEYVPACRDAIGASALPNGKAFYEHRVRYYTTLDLTPKQVHDTGLSEVKRIRAEMDQVIAKAGFKGTFAEFLNFLRTDERFYVDTPEQLLKEVSFICKKMDGQLPKVFKTLPRMPYGVKPIPDFIAPKTTTAYYNQPAGDGSRAGTYYMNTYDLKARPLYELEALSLHEAVPGHHLQIAIMQELPDVPNFRRYTYFTAFVEGWGLYSERLGLETGFYEDPYSDFGRLTYEMWRAMRLVVDTGMHYFGWTRPQAIDYMAANGALSLHNVTTEVDRYISWPGQAVAYKTGELKIRELRAWAERELGARFDVREFHDVVLWSGAVPLDVLEANVRAWAVRVKKG